MKKILFGITSLNLGGAEKSLISLVNQLTDEYEITVFTLYPKGDLEPLLDPKIHLMHLFKKPYEQLSDIEKFKLRIQFSTRFFLKQWAKKLSRFGFDHVVAYLEGPITNLFAEINPSIDKIAWVHTDLLKHIHSEVRLKQAKMAYPKYREVVCVSEPSLSAFKVLIETPIKTTIIGNLIDQSMILKQANEAIPSIWSKDVNFLVVARLFEAKGVIRLVKIHHQMLVKGLLHQFYIIGEGPERDAIEQMIHDYHVTETFHLLGKKENPYPYMKQADVIVSPSYYEGHPLVYLETTVLNRPIVATRTGGSDLLVDYPYAVIVDNDEIKLRKALEQVIVHPIQIKKPYQFIKNDQILAKVKELFDHED